MSIKVLLVDDHQIVRDGIRNLLEKEPDIEVVGQAEDGREAMRLMRDLAPEVVIMDIVMPDLNGIEATHQILNEYPDTKIIALSMHSDRRFVAKMLAAGASGYMLKNCAFSELIRAIHIVKDNQAYLSPGIAEIVTKEYVRHLSEANFSNPSVLTEREREVLQLLAEGRSTREVALRLHVSVKTVETHRRQIMRKLNINSLAELIKYAVREGLTSLDA